MNKNSNGINRAIWESNENSLEGAHHIFDALRQTRKIFESVCSLSIILYTVNCFLIELA